LATSEHVITRTIAVGEGHGQRLAAAGAPTFALHQIRTCPSAAAGADGGAVVATTARAVTDGALLPERDRDAARLITVPRELDAEHDQARP
jgi:hypothetical protein